MSQKQDLERLLSEVKYKISILEEIEKRLVKMKTIATSARSFKVLEDERKAMQVEIDQLIREIGLLEKGPTVRM